MVPIVWNLKIATTLVGAVLSRVGFAVVGSASSLTRVPILIAAILVPRYMRFAEVVI
jgi:hypothetical protein